MLNSNRVYYLIAFEMLRQGHVIVKHNLLFFSASGGIGDTHPLDFDVTLNAQD